MMTINKRLLFFIFFQVFYLHIFSQETSLRTKVISIQTDSLQLDSLSVASQSIIIKCGDYIFQPNEYSYRLSSGTLILKKKCDSDSIQISYRVFPFSLAQDFKNKDTSSIYQKYKGDQDLFLIKNSYSNADIFGGSALNKSGSISRGITFGNSQDLGVNSSLNLELSGDIAPNLKLLASISDDNLPIQPDGNTNKLQEFDQIYIQVYNDRLKLIAGDFWLKKPTGYFLNYAKRAQGLSINYRWQSDSTRYWTSQVSGALSKGKFQRQIIQGVEGNQGPYRLIGADNEPFIIVLAGTEQIFIDGRLLERGQEYDYTINYNTSELTFTARNQITKDTRIVAEFQYSDQNYARSLVQTSHTYHSEKLKYWINAYSEQDAKNQPLQQNLSIADKRKLSEIGDTLALAQISSIDSVGYAENQILYKLVDSTIYDSVLVFSVNTDSAIYRASFRFVGLGNGDYVFDSYNALGKVYRWVEPVAGLSQGDYEPSRVVVTPKKKQMVTTGAIYQINKQFSLESELASSKNDINTFSRFNSFDDQGYAAKVKIKGIFPLSRDSIVKWKVETKGEFEALDRYFSPIQQYRTVEFDRDWNTRGKNYQGNQVLSGAGANFRNYKYGNVNVELQNYIIGQDFNGNKILTDGTWIKKGTKAIWNGFALKSQADNHNTAQNSTQNLTQNTFIRHRAEISQSIGNYLVVGYKDDQEHNVFRNDSIAFTALSYDFFDYQFYLANGDSVKNKYKIFYRERFDKRPDTTNLRLAAKATTIGGEIGITELKNQRLTFITSVRKLEIKDSSLINQQAENSLTSRLDYELRLFKGTFTWNNFYEIGSGLELKKEFLYIKVNDGQGIYTWIDYNGDNIQDLNEFEVAQYIDQASYIRVFTPSNNYVKTYSNEFNQSIFIRPERIWASSKKKALKLLSNFSNQFRVRLSRKTNYFDGAQSFNPFVKEIRDTNLLSAASNIRNTFFFNRTSTIFGTEYTFQDNRIKTLLANGFDSRQNTFHEISARGNIARKFTIESNYQNGLKISIADYTTGRNYRLAYYIVKGSFIYQPNTVFRISLDGRYSEKQNSVEFGSERAVVRELGTTLKYNQLEKGSLQATFSTIQIDYNGAANSAVGFEMLEALQPGINYTWSLNYQRSISKNLQFSLQYNGRKTQVNSAIHSAGMEVRAFF